MFRFKRIDVFGLAVGCFLVTVSVGLAAGDSLKTVPGHLPELPAGLLAKGPLELTNHLRLALGLALRDPAGLDRFLDQVYDPASTNFHRFLTPEEFTERFGPSVADYQALVDFAQTNGFVVTGTYANRLLLDVQGSVENVQRALHVKLLNYRHPKEQRDFFAPDSQPTVDVRLPLADVSGLNNYVLPRPKLRKSKPTEEPAAVAPRTGSSPTGSYFGKDFRAAYLPDVSLTGTGQMLGLLEFDGFYASDITAYETAAGLPNVPLQTILIDGYNGVPTSGTHSGNDEVSLDIEMAIAIAPGLSKVVLFEADPNGNPNDVLNSMAANSQIKQLAWSWGWSGGPSTTTDAIFKQMAAQGQSFFTASGDSDAYTAGASSVNGVDNTSLPNAPASCPYITAVGGTTLSTTGPGGAWSSEKVWNWGGKNGTYSGSSGGFSSYYSLPSWQSGVSLNAAGGSTQQRNLPDVAMAADNIYVLYGNGASESLGGTSCAAPLWAGVAALVNQQARAAGKPAVGFLNPALYALGKSSVARAAFHDIVIGNNVWSSSPNLFYATDGFDLCTGWGTPAGQALIDSLSGAGNALSIAPASGLTFGGPVGGPFAPAQATLVLTNSGTAPLNWSLLNTPSWLNLSTSNGLIPGASAIRISGSLTAATASLPPGAYKSSLLFTNQGAGTVSVPSALSIGQSVVQNGDFEAGNFGGWTLLGNTSIGGNLYNGVTDASSGFTTVHSGSYGAFLGDTNLASLSQNFPTSPGQYYLVSLWVDNPTAGPGQQFILNWQPNTATSRTLVSLVNPAAFAWTNMQFLVEATGTNATVQIQAENDASYFGVDDISLIPIPAPAFQLASPTESGFALSWSTAPGLVYQVQYTTDLSQPNWVNLGTGFVATNFNSSVTDPDGLRTSPQRFYRLIVSP